MTCRLSFRTFALPLAAVLVALFGAVAAPARADTAVVSFKDTTGKEDPVVDLARTFTLSGNTSAEKYTYVKFRAPGGAPCSPSAASDAGEYVAGGHSGSLYGRTSSTDYVFVGDKVNGNFLLSTVGTWIE